MRAASFIQDFLCSLVLGGCSQGMIQRPLMPVWEVLANNSLQDVEPDSLDHVVQIQPQKIKLSLKPSTYHIVTLLNYVVYICTNNLINSLDRSEMHCISAKLYNLLTTLLLY